MKLFIYWCFFYKFITFHLNLFQASANNNKTITNGNDKPRSRSFENPSDPPEFRQNNARLELNLENTTTVKTRRASSIEGVEKKVPELVREEADDFPVDPPIHQQLKRPVRRESSWRQVVLKNFVYSHLWF